MAQKKYVIMIFSYISFYLTIESKRKPWKSLKICYQRFARLRLFGILDGIG